MTIRPGETWGAVGPPPTVVLDADSDRAAARLVEQARFAGGPVAPVRLRGGDLWRTCGGAARVRDATEVAILPVDVGVATVDGRERVFVAHLVAHGRSPWFGPLLAVCNAEYIGRWDVAPRSHPADGRLDVFQVEAMSLADRWRARRRLPTGTHLPHPAIGQRRVMDATFRFDRPRRLWLDGESAGTAAELTVHVEPRALTVVL